MAKLCFSAVRAGGANNSEGSACNVAAKVGETDGFPQSLCGFHYLRLRHAGIKDSLNSRNAIAFCEFITEMQQYHRRPDSRGPRRQHVHLIPTSVLEAHSNQTAIISEKFVEKFPAHRNLCATTLPDGATARGGPWPPLQCASRPLDSLLCLSPFVYTHLSQVHGHVFQPSYFWSSSSSCCIQLSVHLFLGLRCLAFFLYDQAIVFFGI